MFQVGEDQGLGLVGEVFGGVADAYPSYFLPKPTLAPSES